jgi:hypothetical protein
MNTQFINPALYRKKLYTILSTDLSTDNMPVFYTDLGGCSRVHDPIEREHVNIGLNPLNFKSFRCSRAHLFVNTFVIAFVISLNFTYTQVINRKESGVLEVKYAEKLLQLATPSSKNQRVQDKASLPILEGFDLPDPAKILRAAYDLWQPVRDAMPEWVAYMSVRKAHQDGDKSLEKDHREAEQAYYTACQKCPEFQYYRQVHQRLFSPKKKEEIDWYADPHKESSL